MAFNCFLRTRVPRMHVRRYVRTYVRSYIEDDEKRRAEDPSVGIGY